MPAGSVLSIEKFEDGPVWTVGYLVYDATTKEGIVIDVPMWSSEKMYRRVRELNLTIKYIVATHGHWDHMGEMKRLKQLTGAAVCANEADEWMMRDPNGMAIPPPEKLEPVNVEIPLADGAELVAGGLRFDVIHTPGHSSGSICLYLEDGGILFTGDTLFAGSIGRVDLPTGSMDEISRSIPGKILKLPDEVRIFPGHGPDSTIGKEKVENQFIQMMMN